MSPKLVHNMVIKYLCGLVMGVYHIVRPSHVSLVPVIEGNTCHAVRVQ